VVSLETRHLASLPDAIAPDGSEVRILAGLAGGGLAHFELAPGQTSVAVRHKSVEELWFVLDGHGEMWRKLGDDETVVALGPGVSVAIPLGTAFQFRSTGPAALRAVAVTMPPWPGLGEALSVDGKWPATVPAGPN
jgi:mannose-6-phosphate isomerase-like protein (cupin superfamily)